MAISRLSHPLIALFFLASAGANLSQHSLPPIEPLLRNSDPRLVALGAWEALRRQDDSVMPILQELVEHWDSGQKHRLEDRDRFDAMTVILDVLIQRKTVVSSAGITAISDTFPNQALILVSRLPINDAEPILLAWYGNGQGVNRTRGDEELANRMMMARVAAMMLAQQRPQDIAASLLAQLPQR
jgi:hypothetical protein